MESRIIKVKELSKRANVSSYIALGYLKLADYEMDLAIQIAEYYNSTIDKNYPVGYIIRNYWEAKTKEWCW